MRKGKFMHYEYLIAILIGYLLGCLNPAWLFAKLHNKDIQKLGNGNPGASNITLNFGLWAGVFVAVFDIVKAIAAFFISTVLFSGITDIGIMAACAAVIGHMFPFCFKFRGGKGFASFIGLTFCLDLKVAIIILLIAAALAFLTNYIITATFTFIISVPCYAAFGIGNFIVALGIAAVSVTIFSKHLKNLSKIRAGTEPKLRTALAPKSKHD